MVSKCTDIVIRHVAIGGEEGMGGQQPLTSDKFRIHMFDAAANELLGKRDILATLYPGDLIFDGLSTPMAYIKLYG